MEHLDHPSPHFNDAKMTYFALRASSSLLGWEGGLVVPFYTVQDSRCVSELCSICYKDSFGLEFH